MGDLFSVGNLFHWFLDFFMNIPCRKDRWNKTFQQKLVFVRKLLNNKVDKKVNLLIFWFNLVSEKTMLFPFRSCMLQADSEKLRQAWIKAVQTSIATAYREKGDESEVSKQYCDTKWYINKVSNFSRNIAWLLKLSFLWRIIFFVIEMGFIFKL